MGCGLMRKIRYVRERWDGKRETVGLFCSPCSWRSFLDMTCLFFTTAGRFACLELVVLFAGLDTVECHGFCASMGRSMSVFYKASSLLREACSVAISVLHTNFSPFTPALDRGV